MKKPLPHFWNESTRGFIKCDVYAHRHKHACISWSCSCPGLRVNANLLKPPFVKRLHNLPLSIQGVINYSPSTSTSPSAWHAGGLLQLVRCTIHDFKSSYNALFCTQPEEESHPIPFLENSARGTFLLVWTTPIVSYSRGYGMFED